MKKKNTAFTLVEILISLIILVTIASLGFISLVRYRYSNELNLEAEKLVSYLRQVRDKAINGEEGSAWGLRLVNNQTNSHYYSLFKGESYNNPLETIYLSSRIQFIDPANGTYKDIVFQRVTGWPTASTTIVLSLRINPNITKNISINSFGQINY